MRYCHIKLTNKLGLVVFYKRIPNFAYYLISFLNWKEAVNVLVQCTMYIVQCTTYWFLWVRWQCKVCFIWWTSPQNTFRGRVKIGGVNLPSQLERTPQLVCDGRYSKRGWACTPRPEPSPGWAGFSIMMEYMPKSGHCHSVCTLWSSREALC